MTKLLIKVGIVAAVAVGAFYFLPSLRGPFNRAKNTVSTALDDEFCVDNYRAQFLELYNRKADILKARQNFAVRMRCAENKRRFSLKKAEAARERLVAVGTADLEKFSKARDFYEMTLAEAENYGKTIAVYSNALEKTEASLKVVEANIVSSKFRLANLESKRECVKALKSANEIVENLNGVGDIDLALSLERLDDAETEESVKLEALTAKDEPMTRDEAELYLKSICN